MPTSPPPATPDDQPPGHSGRGRRVKLTPELAVAFGRLLRKGGYRPAVCKLLGVGATTFHTWMKLGKRFPEGIYGDLRKIVFKAEAICEQRALSRIQLAGRDDVKHLEWWLERRYPEKWGVYRGHLGDMRRRIAELEALLGAEVEESEVLQAAAD